MSRSGIKVLNCSLLIAVAGLAQSLARPDIVNSGVLIGAVPSCHEGFPTMIHWNFQPPGSRLRHPLVRFAAAVLGVVVIVAVGLFALGALAIGAIILTIAMAVRRFGRPAAASAVESTRAPLRNGVIDGEFVVVDSANTGPRR